MFMIFCRSLDCSPAAPGRDVSQSPQAAEALRTARASGQVAASQSYVLLYDRGRPGGSGSVDILY
jgi:hypothetical protein